MAASRATWPLARGLRPLVRVPRRRDTPVRPRPLPRQPLGAPPAPHRRGLPPQRRSGRPGHRVPGRPPRRRRRPPFFLYFCTGACHSPHHAPAEWIERYRGRFDQGWDAWRDETFARQLVRASSPGAGAHPASALGPGWDEPRRAPAGLAERFMECFAAFLSYTDAQIGRVLAFIDRPGDADDTVVIVVSDNGASSEGGKDGTINEGRLSNFERAGAGRCTGASTRWEGRSPQQLPVGLDHGRQHAVQALEARGPRGRGGRPVHRPLPAPGSPLREAASAGSSPMPSTSCPPCSSWPDRRPRQSRGCAQSHLDGISFAYLLGGEGQGAPAGTTQHFEMFGSARHATTTGGRR